MAASGISPYAHPTEFQNMSLIATICLIKSDAAIRAVHVQASAVAAHFVMPVRTLSWDTKTGLRFSVLGKAPHCAFGLKNIHPSGDPAEAKRWLLKVKERCPKFAVLSHHYS
jgi:hypothetical protein